MGRSLPLLPLVSKLQAEHSSLPRIIDSQLKNEREVAMNETLAKSVGSTVALRLDSGKYRVRVQEIGATLSPADFGALAQAIDVPAISQEEAGAPAAISRWDVSWQLTVLDLLQFFGAAAEPLGWKRLEGKDHDLQEQGLLLLCRLAARNDGPLRARILLRLGKVLPAMHNREVRRVVNSLLLDARLDPRVNEVLEALGDVVVHDFGNGKVNIAEIVRQVYVPPPPPPPPQVPEHKAFTQRVADLIIARDLVAMHALFSPGLRKSKSPEKLEANLLSACEHCGWPVRRDEAWFSGLRIDELRGGGEPRIPKSVKDAEFRNWMWVRLWPDERSELFAYDLGIAVVEIRGELKIGHYWTTSED
jgi:hypothetical protein